MPVAVSPGAPKQKRDLLDYVNTGAQAANALMMLPKAYGDIRTSLSGARKSELETQSLENQAQGKLDPLGQSKGSMVPVKPGTPGSAKFEILGPGGTVSVVDMLPKEIADSRNTQQTSLRKEVGGNPANELLNQANANMANVLDAYKHSDNENARKLIINAAKIFNPNISKSDPNSLLQDGSLPDEFKKAVKWVFGNDSNVLLGDEKRNLARASADAYKRYTAQAGQQLDNYKRMGQESGFAPEDIGIIDTSGNILAEIDAAFSPKKKAAMGGGTPAAAPKQSPSGPKAGDIIDGYRFKGGDPGQQSSWEKN